MVILVAVYMLVSSCDSSTVECEIKLFFRHNVKLHLHSVLRLDPYLLVAKQLLISYLQWLQVQVLLHKRPPEVKTHVLAAQYWMKVLVSVPGPSLPLPLRVRVSVYHILGNFGDRFNL